MSLKTAREYYFGPNLYFNPLWKIVGSPFLASISARAGDEQFQPHFYVSRRIASGGINENEIRDYISNNRRRMLLIEGSPGIGKTTLLYHTFGDSLSTDDWEIVWVNVDAQVSENEPAGVAHQVLSHVSSGFEHVINENCADRRIWWRFFLDHYPDITGSLYLLREAFATDQELDSTLRSELLRVLKESENNLIEMVRVKILFVKRVIKKIPVVVIDNIDQLGAHCLQRLFQVGVQLGEGLRKPPTGIAAKRMTEHGHCKVVIAMRPVTVRTVNASTTTVIKGEVQPPNIVDVLKTRLDEFFERWEKDIIRGDTVGEDRGPQLKIDQLNAANIESQTSREMQERAIRWIIDILTSEKTPFGNIIELVYRLSNYNTRITLVATAGYVASGHIPWRDVFREADATSPPNRSILSWRKAFGAFMLGTHSLYATTDSWVVNVFNAGTRDRFGVMFRLRLLKMLATLGGQRGLGVSEIEENLHLLFDYRSERIIDKTRYLANLGVIEEREPGHYMLTASGLSYLKNMTTTFEYLQHVLVDSFVETEYLVKCERRNENALTRYTRVLRFAQWIRELEIEEMAIVLRNRELDRYRSCYQRDTISSSIAGCLLHTVEYMPGRKLKSDAWMKLEEETRALQLSSGFDLIRDAANSIAAESATVTR